jgi:hypothetical protein
MTTTTTSAAIKPSSDTPLLYTALCDGMQFGFSRLPRVALHGHACATPADAAAIGAPISCDETLFSTPEDLEALTAMFRTHPYPKHRVFIRKGHGFFILADTITEAQDVFRATIVRRMQEGARKSHL